MVKKGTFVIPGDVQIQIKAKIRVPRLEPASPGEGHLEKTENMVIDVLIIPYRHNQEYFLGIYLSKHAT